jgi:hypothetical protein
MKPSWNAVPLSVTSESAAHAAALAHVSYDTAPVATHVAEAGVVTDTNAVDARSAVVKKPIFAVSMGRVRAAVRIADM